MQIILHRLSLRHCSRIRRRAAGRREDAGSGKEKLEGLHNFRNICKVDASKQITNLDRRMFYAGIHRHDSDRSSTGSRSTASGSTASTPELYYFEVRGSAFLWHQVRHVVAILFLVRQSYEQSELIDHLLNVAECLGELVYEMADDPPLALWDCTLPDPAQLSERDHDLAHPNGGPMAYIDKLEWFHVGAEAGGRDPSKRVVLGSDDGKYGPNGIMDSLWALWRKR